MQINKEFLRSLEPCASRYKHFLDHHANFSGILNDFLDLPNLDYDDKVWVAMRVLTKNKRVKWAILCAESVVYVFEKEYPDDKSLSDCINYLKTVNDFDKLTNAEIGEIEKHLGITVTATESASNAAHAARCAASYAASNAAYAAHAAVRAAYASYTAHPTSFAATGAAAYAAHAASHSIESDAKKSQEALNLHFLKQVTSL